jgi:hypothetical protein
MAKFNSIKKISTEDVPQEHRGWFGKVLEGLNPFIQQTVTALTNGLVLTDNNRAVKISCNVAANQSYPMEFNLRDLKGRPSVVLIGALRASDASVPSTAFSVHWTYNDGLLSYTFLGLNASKEYEITLIAMI